MLLISQMFGHFEAIECSFLKTVEFRSAAFPVLIVVVNAERETIFPA